jgi:hypothetical protein
MTDQPDSMIAAAKKVAHHSRIPWPVVQRRYRALQAAEYLPLSRGRSIWYAHPNLVGVLLIGMACPEEAIGDHVKRFQFATPNADGFEPLNFRYKLSKLLSEEGAADSLDHIVFETDSNRVVVVTRGSDEQQSRVHTHYHIDPGANAQPLPLIQTRTVIAGDLIRALQADVAWRPSSSPPYVDEHEPAFQRFPADGDES